MIVPTAVPPTPTPLPPVPPPVITAFSVTPNQIEVNQCVTIYWTTAGGTMAVRILKDGNVVLDNAPFSGQSQDCPGAAGSITYGIEARNAFRISGTPDAEWAHAHLHPRLLGFDR